MLNEYLELEAYIKNPRTDKEEIRKVTEEIKKSYKELNIENNLFK